MKGIKIFEIEKKPRKGLLAIEWIILGYMVLTLLLALFMSTKIHDINPMIWGRFRIAMMMLGLWVVYRLIPCRFTMFTRIALQLLLLGVWYPETFEFNRHFPNLDHLFAAHEQTLCGCQPALLFSQNITNPVFSELMHLGYDSYFHLQNQIIRAYKEVRDAASQKKYGTTFLQLTEDQRDAILKFYPQRTH